MSRSILAGAGLLFFVAACASSSQTGVSTAANQAPSEYDLAMGTVSSLVSAGNEQIAIDRLTQLLGDPGMSDDQMAQTLLTRAELRFGEGNDVDGAVEDLSEVLADYSSSSVADEAATLLQQAEAEQMQLTTRLQNDALSPLERFRMHFRLGHHQEASDIMLASGLQPENSYLVDLYQIGYLCDGDELAGPSFRLTEPDGTSRSVQFCDMGK